VGKPDAEDKQIKYELITCREILLYTLTNFCARKLIFFLWRHGMLSNSEISSSVGAGEWE
jgi:hypothetical protein